MKTMEWCKLSRELPVPLPLIQATTVTEEGKMVMCGGFDGEVDKVYTCWLTVPSLKTMAWEAVTHYRPDMSSLPVSDLLKAGIPRDCVEMLSSSNTSSTNFRFFASLFNAIYRFFASLFSSKM